MDAFLTKTQQSWSIWAFFLIIEMILFWIGLYGYRNNVIWIAAPAFALFTALVYNDGLREGREECQASKVTME